ncbi:MAG: glycosyltransferase family 4 protein [Bacteroides sp.]|nr:glycosyltransferase family 4 protein [Prevotella sp.]MCM1408189.1 glycosyltransferase family 4 protein [Treponema brennaborense]MCM1469513.1 glycosyltransferase family 4 protein [Bacteroides sp.]
MKIGIDTFCCDHGRSGIGLYVVSLIKNLPADSRHEFELFGSEIDRYTYDSSSAKTSYAGLSLPDSVVSERLWHIFRLKKFAAKQNYDAMLFPAGSRILPASFKIPGIAVVNDIVSEFVSSSDFWFRSRICASLRRATHIIAASMFVRNDLIRLGINENRITVVPNGIDHSLFYQHNEIENDTVIIQPFSVKRPYFIYASRIDGLKKKHPELIRAFSLFKKKTGAPHRLVLAGSDSRFAQAVYEEASASPYASDIFLTGYFPHTSLPDLYACADACLFPSVSEGVGLPVLEAMASGLPVACSDAGVLPEITGNNALYFNSDDIEETASVMERIVSDQQLRKKLTEGALEWVKQFSWEKTAAQTLAVIEQYAGAE